MPRSIWLIAKSVLIEAVRRREIYAIVLVSTLLIGAVMTIDFFEISGLTKFYREIALKVMSIATALTVIVLAARQLPREFESRTIYPLLAKPIGRGTFLAGKLLGIMLAAVFCYALFMSVYLAGTLYLEHTLSIIPWALFLQYLYLQLLQMLVLATLGFWLSMIMNLDAAITIGAVLYALATTFLSIVTFLIDAPGMTAVGRWVLLICLYIIPQLTLFDLSDKAVHAEAYAPLDFMTMVYVSLYGLFFAVVFFSFSMISFRGRAL